jgi:hypothetical protein
LIFPALAKTLWAAFHFQNQRPRDKPTTGRWLWFSRRIPLAQKSRQIFVFPAACSPIIGELAFATIEFFSVNAPAILRECFIRHNRVQHLVIQNIPQKPQGHEGLVQCRIDSNHSVFLLDCAKNEVFPWAIFPPASPNNSVSTKTLAKMPLIQIVKDHPQIKMRSFMAQVQLPLHRQLRVRELSFGPLLLPALRHVAKSKRDREL